MAQKSGTGPGWALQIRIWVGSKDNLGLLVVLAGMAQTKIFDLKNQSGYWNAAVTQIIPDFSIITPQNSVLPSLLWAVFSFNFSWVLMVVTQHFTQFPILVI
jgi:hypothetical protein